MQHYEAIVVGIGGIGSAAACQLARRGARVLALDRFPLAHGRGSSHGHTRLIRLAYFEHPNYVPLLRRAYASWRALEAATGRRLLIESGLVTAGPPASAVLAGVDASAREHGLVIERLSASAARARWPALALPDDWSVAFESCAGYLLVEACVAAFAEAATRAGATLEHGVAVHGWSADRHGVTVSTDRGTRSADRLVLAPGPWAGDLLRLPAARLQVLRKSLFWYEPAPADRSLFAPDAFPCFAFDAPAGFFYGFPRFDSRGVKVAEHTGGRAVADPLAVDRGIDVTEQARIESITAAHLPRLGRRRTAHAACLYTMTPDGHFLVGLHPDSDRVAIAAGFSGHGFKFASVIGEIAADVALTGRTTPAIDFLSPTRFA